MRYPLLVIVLLLEAIVYAEAQELTLLSPQQENMVKVWQHDNDILYSVNRHQQSVIEPSRLGLHLDNYTWERALARQYKQYDCWMQGFTIDSVTYASHCDTISQFYGEHAFAADCYNSGTLHLSKHDGSQYRLNVEVRCYDEGIALRYFLPEHPLAIFHKVVADLTEYTFQPGAKAWATEWAQGPYLLKNINEITEPIERAVTLILPNGQYCALADADTDDWCLEKNVASATKPNTLVTTMYSPVDVVTYYATPWKVILTADSYCDLLEHRFLIDNLNPPCAIADAQDWIKPGTIMRCTELTTEAGLRGIDFCAEHNIPYMLFDWKWYVPCTSHDGDATQVIPSLDLHRVVAYGREKGVGIWLYVNQHALMKQASKLFPKLREWGIVGVKSGFVEYASHRWAVWLHDLVRLAAEHHLMMNIHDEYRPTGFSRTYPNLLTQEGIRGNEEFPSACHNTILPFTRMINGAADYTICYYDRRLKTTHGHQLAASLVYYSPLQTIFWYDRPEMAKNEPELAWFDKLKTTWDETRYLQGEPGSHIVVARRSGADWFVAALNGDEARTISIATDFLGKERYMATFYTDDATVDTQTHIAVQEQSIKPSKKPLKLNLQPAGGAVIHFYKLTGK